MFRLSTLLFLIAIPAVWGGIFPLAPPTIGHRNSTVGDIAPAGDGVLLVWAPLEGGGIRSARLDPGGNAISSYRLPIAPGTVRRIQVVESDNEYLVILHAGSSVLFHRLGPDGAHRGRWGPPYPLAFEVMDAAWNGEELLLVGTAPGGLQVRLVESDGTSYVTSIDGSWAEILDARSPDTEWSVVHGTGDTLFVSTVGVDGTVVERGSVPWPRGRTFAAADRQDVVLVWFEPDPAALHSARLVAEGELIFHDRAIPLPPGLEIGGALVPSGTGFDFWFTRLEESGSGYEVVRARLDASGALVGELERNSLGGGWSRLLPGGAASTGSHTWLLVEAMSLFGHPLILVRNDGASFVVGHAAVAESSPFAIGVPGGFVATWLERWSDRTRIMATTVDLLGDPAPSPRVVVDVRGLPGPPGLIAGPSGLHLLTWVNGATFHGLFLDDGGVPVSEPFAIQERVAGWPGPLTGTWNGSSFFIVWPEDRRIFGRVVTTNGHLGEKQQLTRDVVPPEGEFVDASTAHVAFDGTHVILAYLEIRGSCRTFGCTLTDQRVMVERLDPSGAHIDPEPTPTGIRSQIFDLAAAGGTFAIIHGFDDEIGAEIGSSAGPALSLLSVDLIEVPGGFHDLHVASAPDRYRFFWQERNERFGFGAFDASGQVTEIRTVPRFPPPPTISDTVFAASADRGLAVFIGQWYRAGRAGEPTALGVADTPAEVGRRRVVSR